MKSQFSGKSGLAGITTASLLLVCGMPFSSPAMGQWLTDGDGNWTDTANWTGAVVPGVDGDAVFPNILTDDANVTLDASVQLNSISLDGVTNVGDYYFVPAGSETITLTGAASIDSTNRNWFRTGIAGTAGLNISGGGEVILDATNTFTGGLTIDGTNVAIVNDGALPSGNDITMTNGGFLKFWGTANTFFTGHGSTGYTGGTIDNNIDLGTGGQLQVNNDVTATFTGVISGSGGTNPAIIVDFNSDVTFAGANTYTGLTQLYTHTITLTGAGTLGAGGSGANGTNLSFQSSLILDNASAGDEYFLLDENADGAGAKIISQGNSSIDGNIFASTYGDGSHYEFTAEAGSTLDLNGTISSDDGAAPNDRYLVFSGEGDININGQITDGLADTDGNYSAASTNNNVHVIKRGTGTLTINTGSDNIADYWRAGTSVEEGTLAVTAAGTNDGELRSAVIDVQAGATLDLSSFTSYSLQTVDVGPDATQYTADDIGQTISGAGTIYTGSGTFNAYEDAVLAPGDSGIGTLTFDGNLTYDVYTDNPNGSMNFELTDSASGTNDQIDVTGNLTLINDGGRYSLHVTNTGNTLDSSAPYTLMTAASTSGSTATGSLFDIAIYNESGTQLNTRQDDGASVTVGSTSVTVQFAPVESMNWTGAVDSTWDVGTTGNWDSSDNLFYDLDGVSFSGTNSVDIPAAVTPSAVNIVSGSTTFTGAAAIEGQADLAVAAGASVAFENDGDTIFNNVSVGAGSTLTANQAAGGTRINGDLSGSGSLNATAGYVELHGDNSGFTGAMSATNANLVPYSATALSGSVSVNTGATIGIYGQTWTNSNAIAVDGGTIRVGGGDPSAVTLNGDITVGAGGATFQIDGGTGTDGATVNNVLIGANTATANVGDGSTLTATGTISGSGGTLTVSDTGTLAMADGSALTVSNINVTNASLDVSAMNAGAGLTLASGQTLNNDSTTTVTGDVTVSSGATVSGHGTFANNVTVQGNLRVGQDGMDSFIAAKGLVDDFNSYSTGNTGTATGGVWSEEVVSSGLSTIVTSDDGNALHTTGGSGWSGAERDISGTNAAIAVGETQAYFWQVQPSYTSDSNGTDWNYDFMMGLSPDVSNIDTTDAWQDFAVMPFINNDTPTPYINATGPDAAWWALMNPGEWANVWVIVTNDGTNPTYDLYYATQADPNTPILVSSNAYWRGSESGIAPGVDLNAIGFMAAGQTGTEFLIDNIWYSEDPSDFLTNPLVTPWTGDIAAYTPETMTVDGDLTLSASASVAFDIATSGNSDLIAITGALTAAGELDVTLDPSISALVDGDTYDLFDFASASGTFATMNLPTLDSGLEWDLSNLYVTGEISVATVSAIPGDLNGDGYVGLDDLQPILDHWNQNVTVGDPMMGDISGPGGVPDGYVGLDDLQPVLDHWNEGVPPTPSSIPEPASLALLSLGGLALMRRR